MEERPEVSVPSDRPTVVIQTRDRAPRDFYITLKDAEKYGYTRGCGGCTSWFRGLARQPHTEACRNRFRELLKGDARVRLSENKKREFEEKELRRKRKIEERDGPHKKVL